MIVHESPLKFADVELSIGSVERAMRAARAADPNEARTTEVCADGTVTVRIEPLGDDALSTTRLLASSSAPA
jgi:hypothetical protein